MRISGTSTAKNLSPRRVIPVRVLVVDDESLIQWSVCTALASAGFDAVGARTRDEALRIAAEWPPPKVVVLDITPDGDGRELMTDIRSIYPDCHFLVMSTARRAGVTWPQTTGVRIVEKPFDLAELVRLVDAAGQEGSLQGA
jgi:DNA-binding response OmpR family regulator